MKRETMRHPKTLNLAALLGRSRPEVLGFLTLLWDFTAEFAPRGDIGKFPDGAIAGACDWTGNPTEFVAALASSRWLDTDERHRFLVHDWPDHCERWVKAKLERLGLAFIGLPGVGTVVGTTEPSPPRDRTNPNQTKKPVRTEESEPSRVDSTVGKKQRSDVIASIPELQAAELITVDSLPAKSLATKGAFAAVNEHHLGDTRLLSQWFRHQLSLPDPVCGNTEADLILVLAAGKYAVAIPEPELKKNRVAAFVDAVHRGRWRKVSQFVPYAIESLRKFRESETGNGKT